MTILLAMGRLQRTVSVLSTGVCLGGGSATAQQTAQQPAAGLAPADDTLLAVEPVVLGMQGTGSIVDAGRGRP